MEQTYTLTLTENCNLACVYCYEHNRNGRTMNLDTAKAVLYQAFAAMQYDDLLTIDFFGGEPFLEFDLMKEIVKFTREAAASGRCFQNIAFLRRAMEHSFTATSKNGFEIIRPSMWV